MRRLIAVCASLLVSASATQAQTLSVPASAVAPGGSVSVTVTGTAGENYALVGSETSSGLTFNGVSFALGTVFQVLSVGVLDGTGRAVVSVTPPFPARDRYYLQGLTSASAGFIPFSLTPSLPLLSSEVTRLLQAVGGGVNGPNGVGFALSPGVTTARNSTGSYTVSFANQFQGANVIANITPACGLPISSLTSNNAGFTVTFTADCTFLFSATPIRR
jgi:hypothetical protein